MAEDLIYNERIRARIVRLVDDEMHTRVVALQEALTQARLKGLDLVLIASGEPPVCRILDADRFRYERKKAEREHARRQREMAVDTKEIQLRPVTNDNDLMTKIRRARGFLAEGDKVKVTVRFRGRERSHRNIGHQMIARFLSEVGDHKVDKPICDGDSDVTVILASLISKSELVKQRGQ